MIDLFRLDVEQFYNKHIVVYGIGENAQELYERYPELEIKGFIDREKRDGVFCGLPIITLEQAAQENVKHVIIAADWKPERLIYERISSFCLQKGMKVFGVHAGDFLELKEGILYKIDDTYSLDKIKEIIDEHDIISFDIFDTLVMRKTLYPSDVFDIVQEHAAQEGINIPGFRMNRVKAANCVRYQSETLDAIYDEMAEVYHFSDSVRERLMQIEIQVEKDVCVRREPICECLQYAVEKGKSVYLVTDMYHSKGTLKDILNYNGITGFTDIFISGEFRTRKSEWLFERYKENVGGGRYLHIGDNYESDGLAACASGLDSLLIKSALSCAKKTEIKTILDYLDGINDRLLVGGLVQKSWQNQVADAGRITIENAEKYISRFMAPLIIGYVLWLIKEVQDKEFEKVLFVSRDGYLLQKLYNKAISILKLDGMPKSVYLYGSRSASEKCTADETGDLKKGYRKYLESLKLSSDSKYAFVDFVARGTIQRQLEQTFFRHLVGKYFLHSGRGPVRGSEIDAMFEETAENANLLKTNYLIELVLTSPEPSVDFISSSGEVVFREELRSDKQKVFVSSLQKRILDDLESWMTIYCFHAKPTNPAIYKNIWNMRKCELFSVDKDGFSECIVEDSRNGNTLDFLSQV